VGTAGKTGTSKLTSSKTTGSALAGNKNTFWRVWVFYTKQEYFW